MWGIIESTRKRNPKGYLIQLSVFYLGDCKANKMEEIFNGHIYSLTQHTFIANTDYLLSTALGARNTEEVTLFRNLGGKKARPRSNQRVNYF